MHDFLPIIKKSFNSRLKTRIPNAIIARLPVPARHFPPKPKARRPYIFRRALALDRVVQGPRLRTSSSPDYLIAFEKQKENNINSVGPIWIPNRRNTGHNKMKCWVQFLSTPTADTPGTTLLLHFDNKRYIIGNVAEGTQRAAVQRKSGLIKVGDIFLTGTIGWGTTGGILGMILTLADASITSREESKSRREAKGVENPELLKHWLNIHGGKNLTHLLATARRFVFRKGMPIHTQEFRAGQDTPKPTWEPTWKDDNIQVWAMVLEPENDTRSPRKRSHEEFVTGASVEFADGKNDTVEEEDRNDQMRKAVLASMFDSEWRLDALFKKKLSEVQMPTTVFMRNERGKIEKYTGPMIGQGADVPDIDVLVRNPWPGAMVDTLPPTTPATSSVCYLFKGYPQRGKFDPKAAIKLGVQPGKDFGRLTSGQSVIAKDGSTVTPEDVMEPGKEGGGFAIIELPNASFVEPLIAREEWSSKQIITGIGAVIWILGPGVIEDTRLQDFMKEHSELTHIVSSHDTSSNYIALESPASAAIRLHLVDPERFPIPVHSNVLHPSQKTNPLPYQRARVGKTIQLEPRMEIQDDKIIPYLDTAKVVQEASPEIQELADIARKEVTSDEYLSKLDEHQKDIPSKDAEIITLGTGSALPSKYRNVSATLLRVPGYGNYLFDCGENTLGQLKRVLGKDLPEALRDLKAIWISHLHADHHLGTASVIKAWHEETKHNELTRNNKLIVSSDAGMINWLKEYSDVEEFGHDRLEPIIMGRSNRTFDYRFEPEQTNTYGLTSIQACTVEHCHGALAVVFNFPNGFKVAYSGDCRPSREFAKIGQGATLLIHEATFDDELQGDAMAKKHSTTAEALKVGKEMNARRILLTHFSQRYQKIPVMGSHDGKDQVAIVAFDYMRVKIGDFAKVEAFKPALMKLYEDTED